LGVSILPIRTVIFDLGRVIVGFNLETAYERMEALSGLSAGEIHARLSQDTLLRDFETGKLDGAEFRAEVNQRMGTALGAGEFADLWSSIFHREPLIEEALLAGLRKRHRLVLLSNTNPLHFAMIEENFPHIAQFDELVLSHEVGAMKPDAAIYEAAIGAARCVAGECLFFDDLAENVEGARRAGMNAEVFTGEARLRVDLARFGIGLP
jgi:glucose-1-phosphatase